ncbi:SMP-30/gluconolactonase/LRE family protein [Nocardia miyunensis]|uniref:SMP-30/gluconolactonase/LRE family protein n=1 Tax=Nocardia miyunensis TaxID=282684 RepID=UPI0008356181|nr:SMP-30/gluconolactonase/LRE family protein [Nocardia miyunensis]
MNILRAAAATMAASALTALACVVAPATQAAVICSGAGQASVRVGSVPGAAFEGLTVDPRGRAYVTDLTSGRVFRIDAPGAPAVSVATVPGAGGLAWTPDGKLLIGYGSNPGVIVGDAVRAAGIDEFDPATGALTPFAAGLSAASGLAVGPDGTAYATNDFGTLIGRIRPGGAARADWTSFPSANGAVLDPAGRFLYVSRTFSNPGVSRIPIGSPGTPQSLLDLSGTDITAAPDGLTLDSSNRPVVPFNPSGRIVRVDAPGHYCELGTAGPTTSVVSYGRGSTGFSAGRLFAATFGGVVYEIPGGFDPHATTATP